MNIPSLKVLKTNSNSTFPKASDCSFHHGTWSKNGKTEESLGSTNDLISLMGEEKNAAKDLRVQYRTSMVTGQRDLTETEVKELVAETRDTKLGVIAGTVLGIAGMFGVMMIPGLPVGLAVAAGLTTALGMPVAGIALDHKNAKAEVNKRIEGGYKKNVSSEVTFDGVVSRSGEKTLFLADGEKKPIALKAYEGYWCIGGGE